jgi:glycerophosphoryl diester phosphodiesterase
MENRVVLVGFLAILVVSAISLPASADDVLLGRAVLPADTFAFGPTSGQFIGEGPINGVIPPFIEKQPVQGFSAVLKKDDGTYYVMSDNGFGSKENSRDYNLRVYTINPDFETSDGGAGTIEVVEFFELNDPDDLIPPPIVNEWTTGRTLTGADFDIESIQLAPDGTFWLGDEFGPFLIHVDSGGVLLDAPIPLPDFKGGIIKSPQSPMNEDYLGVMNAVGSEIISSDYRLLDDGNESTGIPDRMDANVSSDVINVRSLQKAGYLVIPYTINGKDDMRRIIALDVDGIITDRPDLLNEVMAEEGIDPASFDSEGHRGCRGLRPENTLPAFEHAMELNVTTLELDTGVTSDGVVVVSHNRVVSSGICRRTDGTPYGPDDEVLISNRTLAEIQSQFICDMNPDPVRFPDQIAPGDPSNYTMPSLQEVIDLANSMDPDVRFNIETKISPYAPDETVDPATFASALVDVIRAYGIENRTVIQSFDFRTIRVVQEIAPEIETVALFGDFDDGTNLLPDTTGKSPYLAGLEFSYRVTDAPRIPQSRGFEGMALSADGSMLYPMLEGALTTDPDQTRRIVNEFDLSSKSYTGNQFYYRMESPSHAIGDFIAVNDHEYLVIERDGSQGDLNGFKKIFKIDSSNLDADGFANKVEVVDLLNISDPDAISLPADPEDIGLGDPFAFPFVTIEDVIIIDEATLGVLNDNNYPFSTGRNASEPDDNEFILIRLDETLILPVEEEVVPLVRAHAHNDYEHERPLFDALDHGFCSAEVDIFLIDGELLVAHELSEVQEGRTLQSLYLDPLRGVIEQNDGRVYPDGPQFTLLIDVKTEANESYEVLRGVLGDYEDIMTTFGPGDQVNDGAITAIISGNRAREMMEAEDIRYAAYDGRFGDLDTGVPASFIPLISDKWTKYFTWNGEGPMPEEERQNLSNIVETAHLQGQRVRFWATPDEPTPEREAVWLELLAADVDLINTDDLEGLQEFLLEHDPLLKPSTDTATTELTANVIPAVSITVETSALDFGTIGAGLESDELQIRIANTGTHNVSVTAEIGADESDFYGEALRLNDAGVGEFSEAIPSDVTDFECAEDVSASLVVPEWAGGAYDGTVMFVAEGI